MEALFSHLANTSSFTVLGILAGLLSVYAFAPYIIDTVKGNTRPQRSSWLVWSVLGIIAFFSQGYEGASASLWFAGAQVGGTLIVFLLSMRSGFGRYLSKAEMLVLMFASAGLMIWYFTETATYTLAITISISLIGGTVTVTKAFRDPDSETLSAWIICLLASLCAVLSVGVIDWILLAYPLYLCLLYTLIICAIVLGKIAGRRPRARLYIHAVDITL